MIARIARLLLLFQFLAVIVLSILAHETVLKGYAGWSLTLGIAAVMMVRLAITANSFILSRRYRGAFPVRAQIGLGTVLRLFFTEFFSSIYSSSWTMAFHAFDKRVITDPVGLPVLLVHGYGCNSGYWHGMSKALSAARISHHAITLEPVLAPIDDYLPALHDAVEKLRVDSGSDRIILIGHSMGGLVCRAHLRDKGSAHVAKVITIGTPHHGTRLANHGVGKNVQQMACDYQGDRPECSTWLRELDASENTAMRALCVSIYSRHDNIVAPQSSAHLDGAANIAVDAIGHVTLAMHKRVQSHLIVQILRTR